MTPRELQARITADADATAALLAWLDDQGIGHSGRVSGSTLAAVCGVNSRTWRKWTQAGGMPTAALRLLVEISEVECD